MVLLKNKYKNYFCELLLLFAFINVCQSLTHMDEVVASSAPPTSAPPTQTHWQQSRLQRNNVSRWRQTPNSNAVVSSPPISPASLSHTCDYKELLTNLHDRVGLMVTVDEDLRQRLDTIDKKIVQFESSNLARIESLAAQQMDFKKHLDIMEHIERLTRNGVDQLLGEFDEYMRILNHTHVTDRRNVTKDFMNVDLNVLRKTRQVPSEQQQQQTQTGRITESQKLDALATLLASTSYAVRELSQKLETNVTRLMQQTGNLQRRFNNLYRKQQNQLGFPQQQHPNFYATANIPQQQLISSCAQGVPTTNDILKLQLTVASDPFYVLCEDQIQGGGWTVILNRFNGDINFERGWLEYKHGFGNLAGEFFIGLDKLYALTASSVHELLITMEDFENNSKYARYNLFAIGNEQESYELKLLGKYSGDAGDSLSYHAGSKFSTFDNDNDGCVDCNCAQSHKGAWWYNWCDQSNLMGAYHETGYDKIEQYRGMYWQDWLGPNYSLKAVKMMIRPLNAEQDRR